MATTKQATVVKNIFGVATLDTTAFEEIERDVSRTVWAAIIVILTGLSA